MHHGSSPPALVMETLIAIALVLGGLALLAGGGEALVRAATTLAERAGVTPAVIGLTVVAMGTSLPELVVSLVAALEGKPDIAIGNVVGSNIFNLAAALGLTALVLPLPVHGNAVRLEWPVMFVASAWCMAASLDGEVGRGDGGFFVLALLLFIGYTVYIARRVVTPTEAGELAASAEARDIDLPPAREHRALAVTLAVLGVGIAALVVGGRFLVDGAVSLARLAGMSEREIALTVVAGGTGAPELATSLMAALRRRADVAVANMIGSNIFNILGILGITALLAPVPVAPAMVRTDMWWMMGTALLVLPLLWSGRVLTRVEGGILTGAYVVYVWILLR